MKVDALSLCHELVPAKPLFVVTTGVILSGMEYRLLDAQVKRLTDFFGGIGIVLDGGAKLEIVRVAPQTLACGIDALWSG